MIEYFSKCFPCLNSDGASTSNQQICPLTFGFNQIISMNKQSGPTEAEIRERERVVRENTIREEAIRRDQLQVQFQNQISNACQSGDLEYVPGFLRSLDNDNFLALGNRSPNISDEDTLGQFRQMLIEEEERRFPK